MRPRGLPSRAPLTGRRVSGRAGIDAGR